MNVSLTPELERLVDEKVKSGESVTVTFDKAGTFDVTCTIHPTMNMTVTVQ